MTYNCYIRRQSMFEAIRSMSPSILGDHECLPSTPIAVVPALYLDDVHFTTEDGFRFYSPSLHSWYGPEPFHVYFMCTSCRTKGVAVMPLRHMSFLPHAALNYITATMAENGCYCRPDRWFVSELCHENTNLTLRNLVWCRSCRIMRPVYIPYEDNFTPSIINYYRKDPHAL